MSAIAVGTIVFASILTGALLGLRLRAALPQPHQSAETKEVVKLAMGLVATMTALILGLLLASAKSSYDTQKSGVIEVAAKVAFLDRLLALYGPEAGEVRLALRAMVADALAKIWPAGNSQPGRLDPNISSGQALYRALQKLSPADEDHRVLKSQAAQVALDLGQMRWLLFEHTGSSISLPLLVIVSAWLALIFTSFGLFAPANSTAVVALVVASLCVAGSIFLILELDDPFSGMVQISSAPLRNTLQQLGH